MQAVVAMKFLLLHGRFPEAASSFVTTGSMHIESLGRPSGRPAAVAVIC